MLHLAALLLTSFASAQSVSTAAPSIGFSDYVSRALLTSPELGQAEESLREADYQWRSQTAAAWLPTVSFNAAAYPYGHDPADAYAYAHGRLAKNTMTFNTTVGLNLFNSFQDAHRVSLARRGRNAARYARDASRRDRALAAARAYLDLGLRDRLVEVARENLTGQDEQFRLTKDLYKNGMKSLSDLLKSETDWRSSQLRMSSAESERRRSLASFNSLIERSPDEPARLDPIPEPEETTLSPLADDLASAESRRPEVLRVVELEERAEVARKQARRDVLPVLSADALWNRQDLPTYGRAAFPSAVPNPNYQILLKLALPARYNLVSQAEDWAAAAAARR
ncbi:MAG: TolC family protein, partial [Elusimicrobia bacterium]|nr:TolC family protein [Elusimicrobiota bacterium]